MSTSEKCPVRVFALGDDFKEPNLEEILCRDDVKDLEVVVVSVAGRLRQGKSFLLDMMIRYLRAGQRSEWSSDTDAALDGFEWKYALKSVTKGVLVWPEVFKVEVSTEETVAVVLMDTEGVFDTEKDLNNDTKIFSFSALLSSVQIFNLSPRINADDIYNLELFAGYGRLLHQGGNTAAPSKPFQDLVFLIRDWKYASDHPYGWGGGQNYLDEAMLTASSNGKRASEGNNIQHTFESARCFLMPYPGDTVANSPDFRGYFHDISETFVTETQKFFEGFLNPRNLVRKKINGDSVTLQDWCSHLGVYSKHLRSGDSGLPIVQTLYLANMDATNRAHLKKCADSYSEEMSKLVRKQTYTEPRLLELHAAAMKRAIESYRSSSKMGNAELWKALENDLEEGLTKLFQDRFLTLNQSRLIVEKKKHELKCLESDCEELRKQAVVEAANAAETQKKLEQAETENSRLRELEESAILDEEGKGKLHAQLVATMEQCRRLTEESKAQKSKVEETEAQLAKLKEYNDRVTKENEQAVVQFRELEQRKYGTFKFVGECIDVTINASLQAIGSLLGKIYNSF